MSQTFTAGMHIRYGGTGICLIDRIEDMEYPGSSEPRRCYVLRPLRNPGIEVSVPMDKPLLCERMKPLLTKNEIDGMLEAAVMADVLPWNDDRKLRAQEFKRILAGGEATQLLALVRCILLHRTALKERGKHLTAADDNARKEAERMLDEEFAFSLGMKSDEASAYICDKLQVQPESK